MPKIDTTKLPKYVVARRKASGRVYYYLTMKRDGRRYEHPLGSDLQRALEDASKIKSQLGMTGFRHSEALKDEAASELYRKVLKGAKARGLPVSMTLDDVRGLLQESGGRCSLTGFRFNENWDTARRIRPWAPSIDRKDSSQGYTRENCRVVAACVNIAFNNFGDALMMQMARGLVNRGRQALRTGPQNTAV
jgi:hypothetical protein